MLLLFYFYSNSLVAYIQNSSSDKSVKLYYSTTLSSFDEAFQITFLIFIFFFILIIDWKLPYNHNKHKACIWTKNSIHNFKKKKTKLIQCERWSLKKQTLRKKILIQEKFPENERKYFLSEGTTQFFWKICSLLLISNSLATMNKF